MIKAVIFDLDNTLIDFMKMKEASVNAAIEAMRDAGLKKSSEDIRRADISLCAFHYDKANKNEVKTCRCL